MLTLIARIFLLFLRARYDGLDSFKCRNTYFTRNAIILPWLNISADSQPIAAVLIIISHVALQGLEKLQVMECAALTCHLRIVRNMSFLLVNVGTSCKILAEFNVAVSRPLSTEVFCPAKQDDFFNLLYDRLYIIIYHTCLMQNAVCLLKVPPRKKLPEFCHACWILTVPTARLTFSAISQFSATSPIRRCWRFHFKAARLTSMSLSLGSFTSSLPLH